MMTFKQVRLQEIPDEGEEAERELGVNIGRYRDITKFLKLNTSIDLKDFSVAYVGLSGRSELTSHTHDYDSFVLVVRGSGTWILGSQKIAFKAPALFFIPKTYPHGFATSEGQSFFGLALADVESANFDFANGLESLTYLNTDQNISDYYFQSLNQINQFPIARPNRKIAHIKASQDEVVQLLPKSDLSSGMGWLVYCVMGEVLVDGNLVKEDSVFVTNQKTLKCQSEQAELLTIELQ